MGIKITGVSKAKLSEVFTVEVHQVVPEIELYLGFGISSFLFSVHGVTSDAR